jgi:hypothetical protein
MVPTHERKGSRRERDGRGERDVRDEVGIQSGPCRAFRACLARHAPRNVAPADFFSNLLEEGP